MSRTLAAPCPNHTNGWIMLFLLEDVHLDPTQLPALFRSTFPFEKELERLAEYTSCQACQATRGFVKRGLIWSIREMPSSELIYTRTYYTKVPLEAGQAAVIEVLGRQRSEDPPGKVMMLTLWQFRPGYLFQFVDGWPVIWKQVFPVP